MSTPIWQVDAFASQPFTGNPAGVCLLDNPRSDEWMQHVAQEMNLSETAFLVAEEGGYQLSWFTPACEVILCGHATLAAAHVLWSEGVAASSREIVFRSLHSGTLTARRREDLIELDFPVRLPEPVVVPDGLAEALNLEPHLVARDVEDYLVLVADEQVVRRVRPDFARLRNLTDRGVIVTAAGDEYDFVSRYFAPAAGIDEDPVTGSTHCCLCPFWAEKLGKGTMVGYQASARGGVVQVTLAGDRVLLAGTALTILKGELLV